MLHYIQNWVADLSLLKGKKIFQCTEIIVTETLSDQFFVSSYYDDSISLCFYKYIFKAVMDHIKTHKLPIIINWRINDTVYASLYCYAFDEFLFYENNSGYIWIEKKVNEDDK